LVRVHRADAAGARREPTVRRAGPSCKRRDRRASAARAVGRVLAAVAGSRHAPGSSVGVAGAPGADVAALLKGLAAPVAGAVGTVEQELRTSAEATAGRHRSDRSGR
jgi:hypothetical protein